jgi:hypothetical protein
MEAHCVSQCRPGCARRGVPHRCLARWKKGGKHIRSHGYAAHWNGRRWKAVPTAVGTGFALVEVATVSSTEAWALQTGQRRWAIQRWTGHRWHLVRFLKASYDRSYEGIAAVPGEAWVVGNRDLQDPPRHPYLLHWDGRRWREVENRFTHAQGGLNAAASGRGREMIWAVGEGLLGRYGC